MDRIDFKGERREPSRAAMTGKLEPWPMRTAFSSAVFCPALIVPNRIAPFHVFVKGDFPLQPFRKILVFNPFRVAGIGVDYPG